MKRGKSPGADKKAAEKPKTRGRPRKVSEVDGEVVEVVVNRPKAPAPVIVIGEDSNTQGSKEAKRNRLRASLVEDEDDYTSSGLQVLSRAESSRSRSQKPAPKSKDKIGKEPHQFYTIDEESNEKKFVFAKNVSPSKQLEHMKVVLSGNMDLFGSKDALKNVLTELTAKVMTSGVTGKTDLLIHGDVLEDGRPFDQGLKYKNAVRLGVCRVSEREFVEQFKAAFGRDPRNRQAQLEKSNLKGMTEEKQARAFGSDLWVDLFKPSSSTEIIGNESEIKDLKAWLVNYGKPMTTKATKKGTMKAALVSGPPGIGKTTAAKLCVAETGRLPIILNASDSRNKKAVEGMLTTLKTNQVIAPLRRSEEVTAEETVLIMDEVDGMSGDRGGIKALIEQIKETQIPIICICNDRQSEKVRTLASYCLDIKFKPPSPELIEHRLNEIEEAVSGPENVVSAETVAEVARLSNGDVRHAIANLQIHFLEAHHSRGSKPTNSKDSLSNLNVVTACKKLLESSIHTPLRELKSYFFSDYSLMPFYVFDHYLNLTYKPRDHREQLEALTKLDAAATCLMMGDQLDVRIRKDRNYQLLNAYGMYSTILPVVLSGSHMTHVNFALGLGKISSQNKRKRLVRELRAGFAEALPFNSNVAVMECSHVLAHTIRQLMSRRSYDELYSLYSHYGLTPDTVKENLMELLNQKDAPKTPMADLGTQSREFTKRYKQLHGDDGIFKISEVVKTGKQKSRPTKAAADDTKSVVSKETEEDRESGDPSQTDEIDEVIDLDDDYI